MKDVDDLKDIVEFKSLVKRYDQKIKITGDQSNQPALTADTFEKLLSSAVEKVVGTMKEKSETLAAARQAPVNRANQLQKQSQPKPETNNNFYGHPNINSNQQWQYQNPQWRY